MCAFFQRALKLDRLIAPCVAAGTVVTVLMLGGMAGILKPTLFLLYAGGFAGLIRFHGIRLRRSDLPLIALPALLILCLLLRFLPCRLSLTDDFSHWGLAARHLLESDAFPDRDSALITFQSYPLGTACFIYYICRLLPWNEGLWLVAQNLLMSLMILPVFACAGKHARRMAPVFPALFLLMFKSDRPLDTLVVDWLLSACGIAMAAMVLRYRSNPQKAVLATLPCMIACVWFKSCGIFFSVCTAVFLAQISDNRRKKWTTLLLLLSACVGAFLLWNLHVRLAFPRGMDSKHAVSLNAYAQHASGKSLRVVLSIAKGMAFAWLPPSRYQVFAVLFFAFCFLTTAAQKKRPFPEARRVKTRNALVVCIAVYVIWYMLLFAMYIFSMSVTEARRLAAFERYDSAGLVYAMGLACIILLNYISCASAPPKRHAVIAVAILSLLSAPMLDMQMEEESFRSFYADLVTRSTSLPAHRSAPRTMLETYGIPGENGRYIICLGAGESTAGITLAGYTSKYELRTPHLAILMRSTAEKYADTPYCWRTMQEKAYVSDPAEKLAAFADYDAILIYEEDPVLETQLAESLSAAGTEIPVLYLP